MRAWRIPTVALAVLALAPLLAAPTTAETDLPPIAAVTGTMLEGVVHNEVLPDEYVEEEVLDDASGYDSRLGGPQLIELIVEWSDPRLPARQWMTLDYHSISERTAGLDDGAMTTVTTHLLEDENGRWTGQGRVVFDANGRFSFYTLVGEGAYEGLYALVHGVRDAGHEWLWDSAFEGFIFEGELPSFPRAPTPVTTSGAQVFPPPTQPPAD